MVAIDFPTICDNMGRPWHNTIWNKSDRKTDTVFPFVSSLIIFKSVFSV